MKRKLFLETFLGVLGAVKIKWGLTYYDKIYGTAIYDEAISDEKQEFVWHMTENNFPFDEVHKLMEIIKEKNLIDIDMITVTPDELFKITNWQDKESFYRILNDLLNIEVNMLDNGEETDFFFIHL